MCANDTEIFHQALRVAAELQIADILHNDGPKTCAELSVRDISDILHGISFFVVDDYWKQRRDETNSRRKFVSSYASLRGIHISSVLLYPSQSVRVFYEEGDITSTGNSGKWHNTRSSSVLRKDHPASQRGWVINAGMTHYIRMLTSTL